MTILEKGTAYVQESDNADFCMACTGFRELGYEVTPYKKVDVGSYSVGDADIACGDVGSVSLLLKSRRRSAPPKMSYPHSLRSKMDRPPILTDLGSVRDSIVSRKLLYITFLRAADYSFKSRMVSSIGDIADLDSLPASTKLYRTPAMKKLSLHRFYVLDSRCVGSCFLSGDPSRLPDSSSVSSILKAAEGTVQAAYALDLVVAQFDSRPEQIRNPTLFLSAKDAFSMGSKGLSSKVYASMLEKRWVQLQTISR